MFPVIWIKDIPVSSPGTAMPLVSIYNDDVGLSLLFIPSALLLLHLVGFPEASDRALKSESGYEEGLTWGARYFYPSLNPTVG
jgi:hypothetical protein